MKELGRRNTNKLFLFFHQSLLLSHEGKVKETRKIGTLKVYKHKNSQKEKKRRKQRL